MTVTRFEVYGTVQGVGFLGHQADAFEEGDLPADGGLADADAGGKFGQPDGAEELALVERPVPRPGPGEVLIEVVAAGVNRPDILQRRGLYPPPPGAPDILGLEVSGQVVDVGPGAETLLGQMVCALVAGGGYAEFCVAPSGTCLLVPSALSLIEAAAMPETLFTVWVNLFERGFAADGDWNSARCRRSITRLRISSARAAS